MQKLKTYYPMDPTDPHYSKDLRDMIEDSMVHPLLRNGIEFESTISV